MPYPNWGQKSKDVEDCYIDYSIKTTQAAMDFFFWLTNRRAVGDLVTLISGTKPLFHGNPNLREELRPPPPPSSYARTMAWRPIHKRTLPRQTNAMPTPGAGSAGGPTTATLSLEPQLRPWGFTT